MAKDLLKEYNSKRDFKKTKEPSGRKKVARKKSKKLIFVVQEHHARALHYDFRLELEGVLKSWAVPKGPSLDPSDKRLAVQTEDHPLSYAKFHGTIPEGEYGGGEVFIWDQGTWESEVEDPIAALEKGNLKFRLKGKKLNGSFVLVRTNWRGGGDKKNWLLIKHHDEKEVEGYELEMISEKKKKKASKKTSKKVSKKKVLPEGRDTWPGFIAPQLPRLVTEVPFDSGEWLHEMKLDGYRMQAHLKNGIGNFFTRKGLRWSNKFPHLLNGVEQVVVKSAILDGEIVAVDSNGRPDFQLLQNSIKKKNDSSLRYYAFDLLYLNGKDLRKMPLIERKELLKTILEDAPANIIYSEHITGTGEDFFKVSCEHKLEGIVSKLQDAPYSSGRNDYWAKTKCTQRQEFVIGGWTEPQGGRTGIGALLLGVYEKEGLRFAGRVGTGFNNESLKSIKKELSAIETDKTPFDENSPKGKGIHWVIPSKVCEVSFSEWTNEGILRTPVFQGMREDKPAKDIHMEKAKKKVKPKKTRHLSAVREISSPEKVLFKKDGKTKQDVSDFYQSIAKHMLPYMEDRPLSLVRCPNGSAGKCFYQKHINGNIPDSFNSFPVKEEKGEGNYLSIDSSEGLQELVQLNAYEIHAWNTKWDNYLRPDQIVMDFDPGDDVPWKVVVEAAFELKEMLEDLDLQSFVKLTGGKGIHVHIPIAPIYDWDQVKSFSQTLALELVSRDPSRYTSNMSKKLRKNKIFVDYLRNGYGATAVVPYSLRAKSESSVALPLEWSELKRSKASNEYNIDKALKKIKTRKRDPWEGMLELEQRIEILTPVEKKRKKAS